MMYLGGVWGGKEPQFAYLIQTVKEKAVTAERCLPFSNVLQVSSDAVKKYQGAG